MLTNNVGLSVPSPHAKRCAHSPSTNIRSRDCIWREVYKLLKLDLQSGMIPWYHPRYWSHYASTGKGQSDFLSVLRQINWNFHHDKMSVTCCNTVGQKFTIKISVWKGRNLGFLFFLKQYLISKEIRGNSAQNELFNTELKKIQILWAWLIFFISKTRASSKVTIYNSLVLKKCEPAKMAKMEVKWGNKCMLELRYFHGIETKLHGTGEGKESTSLSRPPWGISSLH